MKVHPNTGHHMTRTTGILGQELKGTLVSTSKINNKRRRRKLSER